MCLVGELKLGTFLCQFRHDISVFHHQCLETILLIPTAALLGVFSSASATEREVNLRLQRLDVFLCILMVLFFLALMISVEPDFLLLFRLVVGRAGAAAAEGPEVLRLLKFLFGFFSMNTLFLFLVIIIATYN